MLSNQSDSIQQPSTETNITKVTESAMEDLNDKVKQVKLDDDESSAEASWQQPTPVDCDHGELEFSHQEKKRAFTYSSKNTPRLPVIQETKEHLNEIQTTATPSVISHRQPTSIDSNHDKRNESSHQQTASAESNFRQTRRNDDYLCVCNFCLYDAHIPVWVDSPYQNCEKAQKEK